MSVIAPVLRYPGSKWTAAPWIREHMPAHEVYVEPFFGSGAVLFGKERSKLETVNDLDGDVVNLFRVLRDRPEALARAVGLTPYARSEHAEAWADPRGPGSARDPVEDARRFLVRCWQNHGMRVRRKGGWANATGTRARPASGGLAPRSPVWAGLPERIALAAERLAGVQIECRPALDVLERYAQPRCLVYADPPYVLSTRGEKQYAHEMDDADHLALLDALDAHPGPALLSGYASDLYGGRLAGWARLSRPALAEGGRPREEVLWVNPAAAAALGGRLF